MTRRHLLVALCVFGASCIDTGQNRARVPLFVAGSDSSEAVLAKGGVPITIDRADLAFGPLYLCAGVSAGDLCDSAQLEWLDTIVVHTAEPDAVPAGELQGVTGTVQSWMYDLGISSQLTRNAPFVLAAASALSGASLVLEARAVVAGITLPFTASVAIQQSDDTELGVPVVRKSTSESFFRNVGVAEPGLVARFEAAAWVRDLDLRPFVTAEVCRADGPTIVCDGGIERSCNGAIEQSQRDCAAFGQICLPGQGCAAQLNIEPDSEAQRSLRAALVGAGRPTWLWQAPP